MFFIWIKNSLGAFATQWQTWGSLDLRGGNLQHCQALLDSPGDVFQTMALRAGNNHHFHQRKLVLSKHTKCLDQNVDLVEDFETLVEGHWL